MKKKIGGILLDGRTMKKFFTVLFVSFIFMSGAFAQVSVDPDDTFYSLVESWELRGLINEVPPLRPYPIANIRDILQTVIEKGNDRDVRNAKMYWEKVTGKPWNVSAEVGAMYRKNAETSDFGEILFSLFPSVNGDITLFDSFVSMGYDLGLASYNHDIQDYLAVFENDGHDARRNKVALGDLNVFMEMNDVLAIGKKNIFVQTGIYRSGYGPFINAGLSLNDNSYHRTNLSFTTVNPKWSYTQQYSAIGATKSFDGGFIAPDKYLAFHALEFKFIPQFSFSYYESIVFGKRLDPSYLMPVPYIVAQEIGGYNDNLQMGLAFKVRPYSGLLWATDVFVDDFNIAGFFENGLLNTRFFTAVKTGLIYTPADSFCTRISLDYTMLMPYTYTHADYVDTTTGTISSGMYNYLNYTNNGIPMGSSYPPNSDRLSFELDFIPIPPLHIKVLSTFLRHGNINESISDDEAIAYLRSDYGTYSTDGGINNHPLMSNPSGTAGTAIASSNSLNFLTQDNLMYVLQEGIGAEYSLKKYSWGQLSFSVSYLFEWIRNKGVDTDMFPGKGSAIIDKGNGTYEYDHEDYSGSDLVSLFRNAWKAGLSNEINNYFSIGLKYQF